MLVSLTYLLTVAFYGVPFSPWVLGAVLFLELSLIASVINTVWKEE